MGSPLRTVHRGWAAGRHRRHRLRRHRCRRRWAAAGHRILRVHPAAAPGRAGRSRTDDQPLVRPLRQDGRVMTITLSREQPNLRNAPVPVRQRRSAGSPGEGSESTVQATREGPSTPAPRGPADASDLTDDPAVPPVLADQDTAAGQVIEGKYPVVAVTGAARGVGRALIARLAESDRVRKVVAIDDHRGDVRGVTWRVADVRDPALAGRLAGGDVVVHTDLDLAPDSQQRPRRAGGAGSCWSPARWSTAPRPTTRCRCRRAPSWPPTSTAAWPVTWWRSSSSRGGRRGPTRAWS